MVVISPVSVLQPPGAGDGVPGTPVSHAYGNPDVSTIPSVDPPKEPQGPTVLNAGQETWWRGGNTQGIYDRMIARDRSAFWNRGTENSGRLSGQTDPPMDGPARPSLRVVNRTINYQQGTDNTANQDDLTRAYTRNEQGEYVGVQGQGWQAIYGGVPGLWQPYGSYAGVTAGPVKGIQSPVEQGMPGDGPHSVFSGPPHGLHTQTMPDYSQTIGRYLAIPQQHAPRVDRPANSPIAGQNYSQTVLPQGQTGTAGQVIVPKSAGAMPARFTGAGWRGQ